MYYAPAPYIVFSIPADELSMFNWTTFFNWSEPTASSAILASVIASSNNFPPVILPANIVVVTVPVSAVVIKVPVISGIVIVLSAVGFVTVTVVSKSSADEPSKSILVLKRGKTSKRKTLSALVDLILGKIPAPVNSSKIARAVDDSKAVALKDLLV